jgi:hypothetical protein
MKNVLVKIDWLLALFVFPDLFLGAENDWLRGKLDRNSIELEST